MNVKTPLAVRVSECLIVELHAQWFTGEDTGWVEIWVPQHPRDLSSRWIVLPLSSPFPSLPLLSVSVPLSLTQW